MFEHDQQDRREMLFQARHWRHCQVSVVGAVPGRKVSRVIAAPHDQQIVSSASFTTPQWGQSQLGPTSCGSFRARMRQSTHAKTTPPTRRRRNAPDRKSSTMMKILSSANIGSRPDISRDSFSVPGH